MSIFKKLFGKGPAKSTPEPARTETSTEQQHDPNLVRVFDKYGQELYIDKEQWRTSVLPHTLQSQWNDPDLLYGTIVSALNDGFVSEILAAAEQLHRIDPDRVRASCIYGIALMKNHQLDDAERILKEFLRDHGENGPVLTNLSKVYAERNQKELSEATLWRALEVDPNQDNGLGCYLALHRDQSGAEAGLSALKRVAALPASWRAQIWLARAALESGDVPRALTLYHESLSRAGQPIPAALLMQMSGDLGNRGYLAELLQLTESHFDPDWHGLEVGNNLIKAHLELGHIDAAHQIVEQLYGLKRPDWAQTLGYWDSQIAAARIANTKVDQSNPLSVSMLALEGPIWLKPTSAAAALFPAPSASASIIAFLGSSAEKSSNSESIQVQMPDAAGRISRALPLFLAEQVQFKCHARVETLVPWVASGGFVLSGTAWSVEDLPKFASGQFKGDFLVTTHLKTESQPWGVELRLFRISDGKCLGSLDSTLVPSEPGAGFLALAASIISMLKEQAGVSAHVAPQLYELPDAVYFADYLLRLEQLLAVRCSSLEGVSPGFLNGEREILDGNVRLCLACSRNVVTRILLAETVQGMNRVRPEVVKEFSEKVGWLQTEQPLKEPAGTVVSKMLAGALAS